MVTIPKQLHGYERLIKLEPESKAPVASPEGPFYSVDDTELRNWIQNGGNVGLNLGELVALDVDTDRFREIAENSLPDTFTVRTGSGGEHRYYRSEWSGKRQFKDGEIDLGSVRSGNWYTVIPPSIHDETGNQYTVLHDRPIQPVPELQIQDFLADVSEESDSQHSGGGGGGGGGGCVGGSSIPQIPSEYPNQSVEWSTLRNWLSANGLLESLNRTVSSDWSGLEFKIAKCLAEAGFSETSISDAMSRLHHESKWHSRGSDYRTRTVRKAIVAACNDDYVDFSETGDMTGNTVESRKTESGAKDTGFKGGDNMVDFNDTESVLAKESNAEGSTAVKAVKVEGKDGNDEFEFVSLRKGSLRERETADGDTALVVDIDDTNGNSVGSPDDLDVVIDALEQLKEELE